MMKLAVILSFALALTCATDVERCVNHGGDLPSNVHIEGCRSPPCVFPQLRDAIINLTFRAPRHLQSMRTLATAYLGFIPIPYDLGANADTCNFLTNTRCPIASDIIVQYTLRMFIESWFPAGTSATIEFRIVDQSNNPVICIRVPIRISRFNKFIARSNQMIPTFEVTQN